MRTNRQIPLNQGMSSDTRGQFNSVVNSKWIDKPNVLFPRVDLETFDAETPDVRIRKFVNAVGTTYGIGQDATRDNAVYEIDNIDSGTFGITYLDGSTNNTFADAEYYFNGTNNVIYGLDDDNDVWSWNIDTSTYVDSTVHTSFATGGTQVMAYHPMTDRLYYACGFRLYNQTGVTFSSSMITLPANYNFQRMFAYKNYLILIGRKNNGTYSAFFYNVITAPTTFETVIPLEGINSLGYAGTVSGKLTVVGLKRNIDNTAEYKSEIFLMVFNGSTFQKINSLQTGFEISDVGAGCADEESIYFSLVALTDNYGTDTSGVYRATPEGELRIWLNSSDTLQGPGLYEAIIFTDQNWFLSSHRDGSNDKRLGYMRASTSTSDYTKESIYITPFLEDGFYTKQLTSFELGFEKTTADQEAGTVQYRLKKGDAWTTIMTVDADNNTADRQITRKQVLLNSGLTLPQFREIQFRIVSTKLLKITYAGYSFEFINDSYA